MSLGSVDGIKDNFPNVLACLMLTAYAMERINSNLFFSLNLSSYIVATAMLSNFKVYISQEKIERTHYMAFFCIRLCYIFSCAYENGLAY